MSFISRSRVPKRLRYVRRCPAPVLVEMETVIAIESSSHLVGGRDERRR